MSSMIVTLIGRDRSLTVAFLGVAAALAAIFGGIMFLPEGVLSYSSTQYFQSVVLVTGATAALSAYLNDGLLVSWALAAAGLLPFAVGIAVTDAPIGDAPTLLSAAGTLAVSVGLYTLVVGSLGYVVGIIVRRLSGGIGIRASPDEN